MDELPSGSVALTITSPPYWNAIDYDRHSRSPGQNYRTRGYAIGYGNYCEYLEWLLRACTEIYRVTKPGGFMVLVVGTVLFKRKHYPLPFDISSMLTAPSKSCWEFHQDIVWHKVTGGVKRAGVFIQNPAAGYFYPNIMTEYILVFRKSGPLIYHGKGRAEKEAAKQNVTRLFTNEIANNVWHIAPVPPGHINHPCPFPEDIPHRIIKLYSYEGDLVLDPFCGSGQTLKAARHLHRFYCGYEINESYVELARKRVQETSSVRKEQLIALFEKESL